MRNKIQHNKFEYCSEFWMRLFLNMKQMQTIFFEKWNKFWNSKQLWKLRKNEIPNNFSKHKQFWNS